MWRCRVCGRECFCLFCFVCVFCIVVYRVYWSLCIWREEWVGIVFDGESFIEYILCKLVEYY